MNVPKFDPNMKLNRDEDGTVVCQREVTEYSCYHIAHQKAWENECETDPKAVAVSAEAGSAGAEESKGGPSDSMTCRSCRKLGEKPGRDDGLRGSSSLSSCTLQSNCGIFPSWINSRTACCVGSRSIACSCVQFCVEKTYCLGALPLVEVTTLSLRGHGVDEG